jgi:chemotaxis protein MotB
MIMKRKIFPALLLLSLIISTVSCVSGLKFKKVQDESRHFMDERDTYKADNITLEMANKELKARLEELQNESDIIAEELSEISKERDEAINEKAELLSRYNDLEKAHEELIRGNVQETQKLLGELQAARADLEQKENILRQLEANLDSKRAALDELNYELEERNKRLIELEKILNTQKMIAEDLKNKVSNALFNFENNGLTVSQRDGKVYVSLEEKLLFRSGSWDIDANGRDALRQLAGVLERNPDIQVIIEGHTDNVPYKPGNSQLADNWDLSVKRATTVIRVLLESSAINPKRLTASGRGEFFPVDERNTADARQRNRRTEIILTPDLSELYDLINKY